MNGNTMTTSTVSHASFTIERTLKSAPAKVFRAFADLNIKKQWFGAGDSADWTESRHDFDFRVGGKESESARFHGGVEHTFDATYYDIVPDQRIVYAYEMHLDEKRISVSLATIELEPTASGGTFLTLTEQGAFLDGLDFAGQREEGTKQLLDSLVRVVDGE